MIALKRNPLLDEYLYFLDRARPRPPRKIREFAEAEIICPDGPYKDRPFRIYRQPCAGLWFDLIDSGRWRRYVMTAPSQSGKTLSGFVIPILYHLFEMKETVICGLPSLDMAYDKWVQDLLPAIEACRFRDELPRTGAGSRGGKVDSIRFRHGPTLKFMSGGGSDKKRAGFTSRVLVITETDGMDEAGGASREADKITQMEARTRAFGSRARIYMECTVSVEKGRTWQEYTKGTESKIAAKCRHCGEWVTPDRENLIGWQDAETVIEARETAAFACPGCGGFWTEEDRREMNASAKVLHRGERLTPSGQLKGTAPQVETLGFRYHAFHNLLMSAGDVSADEWHAARNPDEDNAEKAMRQFVWALPHIPSIEAEHHVEVEQIINRQTEATRRTVPSECKILTAGVDVGKYLLHWYVIGWAEGARGRVIDYGRIEVPSQEMPLEQAVLIALREWREIAVKGFPIDRSTLLPIRESWIDTGYATEAVYQFCRESGRGFQAVKGFGFGQRVNRQYQHPSKMQGDIRHIGDHYHITYLPAQRITLCHIDTDHWKTWVHGSLTCPKEGPGAMTLFRAPPIEHLSLAKHLTAEEKTFEFIPGRGEKIAWNQKRKNNHWFDSAYMACAAGNHCGVKLIESTQQTVKGSTTVNLPRRPDGKSFFVSNR